MPRKENSSHKPADKDESTGDDEPMDVESNPEEEESGNEDMEDMLDILASPSPEKKGMEMRSGRTKRRRSVETTGLTPPEKLKSTKKARITATIATTAERREPSHQSVVPKAETESVAAKPPMAPTSQRPPTTTRPVELPTRDAWKRQMSSRSSLLSTDATAVANAQDPESSLEKGGVLGDGESNRQLFAAESPGVVTMPPPRAPSVAEESSQETEESQPTRSDLQESVQLKVPDATTTNGDSDTKEKLIDSSSFKAIFWRIGFMVLFAYPMAFILWPICVKVSNFVIPLKELQLPQPSQQEILVEPAGDDAYLSVEPPSSLSASIESLPKLRVQVERGRNLLERFFVSIDERLGEISSLLGEKKAMLERASMLSKAETLLLEALNEGQDLESETWQQLRTLVKALGHTMLDTTSIQLWQVNNPERCTDASPNNDENDSEATAQGGGDVAVQPIDVDEQLGELSRMTQMSTASLMMSAKAEEAVRSWIKAQLEATLEENEEVTQVIVRAQEETPMESVDRSIDVNGLTRDEIIDIISGRLDVELADRTGSYDFASIYNGAKIIREGRRATSKSLVDGLPLGNRLLQLSQLQFYGFGPEAAITPTYPTDALGQCWSFEEMPIEALQKLPRSSFSRDEHKNGNLGTLTISLPMAVEVRSVVIEHPPQGATDQIASAIRGFRVIGYEDAEAETKSWPLGSFEYNINSSMSLQSFEVETESFGRNVPPLHSITLAIDSNWGNAYSCLYRFRVHGDGVEEEDLDQR